VPSFFLFYLSRCSTVPLPSMFSLNGCILASKLHFPPKFALGSADPCSSFCLLRLFFSMSLLSFFISFEGTVPFPLFLFLVPFSNELKLKVVRICAGGRFPCFFHTFLISSLFASVLSFRHYFELSFFFFEALSLLLSKYTNGTLLLILLVVFSFFFWPSVRVWLLNTTLPRVFPSNPM